MKSSVRRPDSRRNWRWAWVGLACLLVIGSAVAADPPIEASAENDLTLGINPNDPASVQRGLEQAEKRGTKHVVIPPGVYRLPGIGGVQAWGWHLRAANLQDVEIDATGATLIFTDPDKNGLRFTNCRGVTLRGARIQRAAPPSSQATIESIDPAGNYIDLRIAKGYPDDLDNAQHFPVFWANLFSADGKQALASVRCSVSPPPVKRLDASLFRVRLGDTIPSIPVPVAVGMHVAWRGQVRDDVLSLNTAGMRFIDLTIAGGSGMVFHEIGGDGGNLYSGCKVTYPARPEGADEEPILSTAADGLHSHDMVKGPTVENCIFEGMADDGIAIHGGYAMAAESGGRRLVGWVFHEEANKLFCKAGETLRFYDKTGVFAGSATVESVKALPGYKPSFKPEVVYRSFQQPEQDAFVEIQLDRDAPASFAGGLISNTNRTGSGYVIRDCVIRSGTARGILAKGSDGLIEGCTIEDMFRAGIEFMSEMEVWSESDYTRNVVVRGNTLRRVCLNRQPGYLRHPGAITLFNYRARSMDLDLGQRKGAYVPSPGGHRHILIEDNTIEDVNGTNLLITSAEDVTVRNNRFVRPMEIFTGLGADKGIDPHALVWLTQCRVVTFEGNEVIGAGPAMHKIVEATDTAQGAGFDSGFRQQSVPAASTGDATGQ